MPAASAECTSSPTWFGHADTDRVAEADLVDAEVQQPARDVDGGAPARQRPCTGSRTRSTRTRAATSRARPARARTGAKAASDSVDRHPDVVRREGVGRRGEDGDRIDAGRLRAGQAALVRDEHRVADAARDAGGAARSSSASASCGMARGETNDVASISRRPASASSSMKRSLSAVGIGVGLVLQAVARPDLVDPDASLVGPEVIADGSSTRSAERRVHRPLDAGDLDLDPAEQVDRLDVLLAAVLGLVALLARLPVEVEQLLARLGQLGCGGLAWLCPVAIGAAYRVRGQADSTMARCLTTLDLVADRARGRR